MCKQRGTCTSPPKGFETYVLVYFSFFYTKQQKCIHIRVLHPGLGPLSSSVEKQDRSSAMSCPGPSPHPGARAALAEAGRAPSPRAAVRLRGRSWPSPWCTHRARMQSLGPRAYTRVSEAACSCGVELLPPCTQGTRSVHTIKPQRTSEACGANLPDLSFWIALSSK